jgi:hypothetical protein
MNCQQVEQLLSPHLEGLISDREVGLVETHLDECLACRRLQEEFLTLRSRLRALAQTIPGVEVERHAIDLWLAERQTSGRSWRTWFRPASTAPVATRLFVGGAAAALFLAIVAYSWFGHARVVGPSTPSGDTQPTLAEQPQPAQMTSLPRSTPQPPGKAHVNQITTRHPASPGDRDGVLTDSIPPVRHDPERARADRPHHGHVRHQPSARDDLEYVNTDPEGALQQWVTIRQDDWARIEARVRGTIRVRDDFVTLPFPRLAAVSNRQIAQAVESYKREAAVVDPRLAREVTCALKATALSDLCDQLRTQTGIQLTAGRSVADEKVTVFVKDMPVRELMRQLSRAFGYTWLRSGQATADRRQPTAPNAERPTPNAAYRYELAQDLKSQLLEEELRNQDLHAAMLALDQQMAAYQPYLNLSMDELKMRLARGAPPRSGGPGSEKNLLQKLRYNWGVVKAYHRLAPAQHLALLNGEQLEFSSDAPDPLRRLPPEWRQGLLESSFMTLFNLPPAIAGSLTGKYPPETPVAQLPGAMPTVSLRVDRSELGQLALMVGSGLYFDSDPTARTGMGLAEPLAVGRNPSATKPDNASANHERRKEPFFQRTVSFRPAPSCPRFAPKAKPPSEEKRSSFAPLNSLGQFGPEPPHVSTADVWEAVHRATGLNILADSHSRFYPVPPVTVERRPLFEGLCQVADALGVRWKKEGDFLVCRSASFFWDKLKEVPNRYLARWRENKVKQRGLPLEDLLEMAALSEQQLNSATVGKVVQHCWGLDEWWLVGHGTMKTGVNPGDLRPVARFLAGLTPAQRRQAQLPEWLAFAALTPAQQQALTSLLGPPERTKPDPRSLRFQFVYAPAGTYVWDTLVTGDRHEEAWRWPMVVGKTREAALTDARRLYPPAAPAQIVPSRGVLWLGLTQADGQSWGIGREPPMIPVTPE